jgi:NADPH:quinone reductase-like Zn-dependent oxidoreductase
MPRTVIFDEIGEADVLQIVEEPIIEPAEGEVRVKIEAFGINRADRMLRTGVYARPAQLPARPSRLRGHRHHRRRRSGCRQS